MKNFLLITCIFFLASCSIFSPIKNNAKTYALTTKTCCSNYSNYQYKSSHGHTLAVAPVQAMPVYNSNLMAYSTYPYQVAYFAKSTWVAAPADMLQPLIIQTLQNTHYFYAVNASVMTGNYDYILNTQLIELQQNFCKPCSVVRLTLRAQLVNATNNHIIAAKEFSVVERAPQNTPYGGVIAANRATTRVLEKLTQFCLQKL